MKKILLVDDEERMLDLLALYIEPTGFSCDKITSGKEALNVMKHEKYDAVILDVMMPDMDGWEICREIRKFSNVPVIMLTAREGKEDVVKGLKLGADDYITKPFNEQEFIARINAVLRRFNQPESVDSGLVWDHSRHELRFNGKVVSLTPKEFSIIGYFMNNPNRVYERDQLIELLWGIDSETEGRTIDSHVRNMRDKIRKAGFPIEDHLKTVWGVGYKWLE